ncbi:hypothetical protein F9231_04415 [Bacillus safensis]|nr:hypothetical protein BSL056_10430 [Bacillus safensis]KAB3541744.1 hypothetical protein F9229_08005 [Bacillus safensis]KAB3546987.1 hypothetical protein F9231_03860 [Bacillus safensis]KAB3547095.1 hypothetical protein F9231_04415 [Bacillus safensis]PNU24547.1 hypothetical protein C1954_07725 [Bacillus stratosphericus]
MKHLSPLVNQTTKQLDYPPYQGFERIRNLLLKTCPNAAKKIYFSSSIFLFFSFSINKRISSKKTSPYFSLF